MMSETILKKFPASFVSGWGEGPEGLWQGIGGTGSDSLTSIFRHITMLNSLGDNQWYSTFFITPTFFLMCEEDLRERLNIGEVETRDGRLAALQAFNNSASVSDSGGLRIPTQDEVIGYFSALIDQKFSDRFVFMPFFSSDVGFSDGQIERLESSLFFQMIKNREDPEDRSPEQLAEDFKDHPFVAFT